MNSAQFVGRVGSLAVALGVGAAVFTGSVEALDTPANLGEPGGFREVLELAASYGKPWITENGIADADDSKRPSYIVNHIAVVQDLASHGSQTGMDVRGYTYWSFVDNLEWAGGYDLQFGLYGSDPNTPELERTPKPESIAALSGITTANGLPLWLLGLYVPDAAAG